MADLHRSLCYHVALAMCLAALTGSVAQGQYPPSPAMQPGNPLVGPPPISGMPNGVVPASAASPVPPTAMPSMNSPGLAPPPPVVGSNSAAPATGANIVDVRVMGNHRVNLQRITPHIYTRAGRPFDLEIVTEDVRRLTRTNLFVSVAPTYQNTPEGLVVIFRVTESPSLNYVKYVGNTVREKTLAKQTGLKKGDSIDPYMVNDARRKLEEYYTSHGYSRARVTVIEGDKPGDQGAVFLINEGQKQRVWNVEFVGNEIASDGRLQTQIQSKRPLLYLFKGEVDRAKIDADVERLTAYYRGMGFFQARIGRELEFNEEEDWLTLRFVIDEGPRYAIREISFIGNKKFDSETLRKELKLEPGQFFDQGHMTADVSALQDKYGGEGYIFATVDADPRFLEEPGQLDLVYRVQEGDRYRIGRIDVVMAGEGTQTRRNTILNYVSLKSGDIADTRKLRADQVRLQRSGLFMNNPAQGVQPKITFKQPELAELDAGEEKESPLAIPRPGELPRTLRGQSPDDYGDKVIYYLEVGEPIPPQRDQVVRFQSPSYGPAPGYSTPPSSTGSAGYLPAGNGQVPMGRTSPDVAGARYAPQVDPRTGQVINTQYAPAPATAAPGYGAPAYTPSYLPPSSAPAATAPPSMPAYGPASAPTTAPTYGGPTAPGTPAIAPYNATPPSGPYSGHYVPVTGPNSGVPASTVSQNSLPPPINGYGSPEQLAPPVPWLDPNEETTRTIDGIVSVSPTQTGKIMLGVGVNSNAGLVGSIVIDEQNFDWRRTPDSVRDLLDGTAFRGGGQRLRIEAVPGTQLSRYVMNFTQPFLFDTPISFSTGGYYFQRFYRDWNEQRLGGTLGLGYQFPTMPNLTTGVSLRMEGVNIYDPKTPVAPDVQKVLGDTSLYTFRWNLAHDTRDSTFLATQGHYIDFAYEQGFGEFDFPRATIDARQYFMLRERPDHSGRQVMTLSTSLGFAGSNQPVYENFFAGGYSTIRGFAFRGAVPLQLGTQVGGQFMWLNTVEYMFPITQDDMLRGVAFCDFGTVESSVTLNSNSYRVSPGLGLRITLPAMGPAPIALDFAAPVAHMNGDTIQNFSFFVGMSR